ncbi:phage tail protein [Kaistella sp. G5-32]|uniref:Phage tail protein n=1 Tax=Kaistella gelatinilytica TaxID=2787636 RepID=A0ABS0F8V9_9FLAO|nr:phage tail protein [Kaistella gelatinilytica]MBF8456133.1 phage tail protein [Kaistella gelatinilytica]
MTQPVISQYHFLAEWGGSRIDFLEISGLDIFVDVVPMRGGSSPEEIETKIPGLTRYNDIILKRAVQVGDNEFYDWIKTRSFGNIERRDITISLLNEQHEPVISWRVKNCFPSQYIGPVLISNDSELATETLVLTHEGFSVEHLKR